MDSTQVVEGLGQMAKWTGDFAMFTGIIIAALTAWASKSPKVKLLASLVVALATSIGFQFWVQGVVTVGVVMTLTKVAMGYTGVTLMGLSATGVDEKMAKTDWRGRPR